MRTVASAGTLTAAVTAALLLAPTAYATAPGDNGTVKIHDAATGEELRKNEPHVCTFYLDAFGFDAGQNVDWRIESWAPTAHVKGETVKTGSLKLDGKGHLRSEDQSLPDGHYKLFWNFDGEHGKAKHKVFWVDCKDDSKPGGGKPGDEKPGDDKPGEEKPGGDKPGGDKPGEEKPGEVTPSDSATEPGSVTPSTPTQPGEAPASSAPEGTTETPSAAASASASSATSPSAHTEGDLAETGNGAPVALLSAVAAALVAAGGFLVIRRRKAQQH
ncbi:LPXTG cell wall anchor domain-containing protein [Streptomyces sp. NBC_01221]|uniref:LPXTG cell wall anchor domain-containing protein n=1 Tax=unclassified Streptomyces TaxID=2593676 RepID=UPI002257E405|nr:MULTISPECIES: LPXTG cell wall anchor domain-containing protein [unclassified Streptomyces]MCX4786942.1 LPXTG cell wall anchor domain-containing protein [Streptomyces sp. NBC_01221]WSJ38566.1 LPXTG cell wall anchor domain-containing protein [Streptomyces sp. NBC_01321]